ncbi:glycosyltransferase family protein [Luteibaculum oceani]|uniref:Glycosyltransferase family 4 protein n=1 Tax=Luteibaculum oceani TaxID=1294296 RepID=A0A5C6V0Y1_9FLAO|nr:glycosyltransferase family 4 protein [Luteibaculum oceani]TXC76918.1 glycosyltransferase family 4 protein [Luteibaculum oceani]
MKKIIFIHSGKVEAKNAGSNLRPAKMLAHLRKFADVFCVSGEGADFKERIVALKNSIASGVKYDAVYVENRTLPLGLHIQKKGILPFKRYFYDATERDLLEYLLAQSLPIHYFYRDIYWDFDEVYKNLPLLKKRYILHYLKKYGTKELRFLKEKKIHLYVPSQPFADYLLQKHQLKSTPLSPGGVIFNEHPQTQTQKPIQLFYVGGVSSMYISDAFLGALEQLPQDMELTLCCRKPEYEKEKLRLGKIPRLKVIHQDHKGLQEVYPQMDIGLFPLLPSGYGKLSYSIKIPEYICNGLPMLAMEGTISADLIAKKGIGWITKPNKEDVLRVLKNLSRELSEISGKKEMVAQVRQEFTWEAVCKQLMAKMEVGA